MKRLMKASVGLLLLLGVSARVHAQGEQPAQTQPAMTQPAGEYVVTVEGEGVTPEQAAKLKAQFETLMAKRKLDLVDAYAGSDKFAFRLTCQPLNSSWMIYRDAKAYRFYHYYLPTQQLIGLGVKEGVTLMEVDGEQTTMHVVRDVESRVSLNATHDAMEFFVGYNLKPEQKEVVKLLLTDVVRNSAMKKKAVTIRPDGRFLAIQIKSEDSMIQVRYNLEVDQLVLFRMLGKDNQENFRLDRFAKLAGAGIPENMKLRTEAVDLNQPTRVRATGDVPGFMALLGAVSRLMTPLDHERINQASRTLAYTLPEAVFLDNAWQANKVFQDDFAEALSNPQIKSGDLEALIDRNARGCRVFTNNGMLDPEFHGKILRTTLWPHKGDASDAVGVRRQLLLADIRVKPGEIGITDDKLTAVDRLMAHFLVGVGEKAGEWQEKESIKREDPVAAFLSAVASGEINKLSVEARRALVSDGLDGLDVLVPKYFSAARLLSNVLRDPAVRAAVEEIQKDDLAKAKAWVAEDRMALLLEEDADPENLTWLNGLKSMTMDGLKGQPMTERTIPFYMAVRSNRGLATLVTDVRSSMRFRTKPENVIKTLPNGKPDWNRVSETFARAHDYEMLIEAAARIKGVDTRIYWVVLNEEMPWKWRREMFRILGDAMGSATTPPAVKRTALGTVGLFQRQSPFWKYACKGMQTYCTTDANVEWPVAAGLLFDDDREGLIKLTGAKDWNGALKALRQPGFVNEHEAQLKELAGNVKVVTPVEWLKSDLTKKPMAKGSEI
jgi:hypothetical protein